MAYPDGLGAAEVSILRMLQRHGQGQQENAPQPYTINLPEYRLNKSDAEIPSICLGIATDTVWRALIWSMTRQAGGVWTSWGQLAMCAMDQQIQV